ncbi:mandelate racemase [Lacibacterium aquatile]|uniref:Mandelate racemase n=1 Tax=Lacibacterium aquatile TaxID=1168082 RepID=A0ABW5E0Z4_9PROT
MSRADAPRLRLVEAELYERPVTFRLPFRFGAVTLTAAPQAFVRVRIRLADGREGLGQSAELIVPKWFDKNPDLSNEENFSQLRASLREARIHLMGAGENTAFGLSASVEKAHHAACATLGLGGLIASFGLALLERAILDALCKLLDLPAQKALRANLAGIDATTAPDLKGFDLDDFLTGCIPQDQIHVRHTIGMLDAIFDADRQELLNDGLPDSVESAIAAYGHRYFKVKLGGQIDADLDRLTRIASLLDAKVPGYRLTLDGNEQYPDQQPVIELWRKIGEQPSLKQFAAATLFIEQPIARAKALSEPIHELPVAVEIDESDADIDSFVTAKALGYRGISSKSCKGIYRAILNRARVASWGEGYFMSAEDLTTQGGVAVQQDLLLASFLGLGHVERNGHHYVDGMAGADQREQEAFLTAHADLYQASNGRTRLAIQGGSVSLKSLLAAPGLGSAVGPDWAALAPLS